jgi:glucose-6-phosphate-specific signal transduction histidine kinase
MNCGPPHVRDWRDFVKGTLLEIAAGETKLVESAIALIEVHAGFTTQHVEAIKEHALHLVMPSAAGRLILKARIQEYKNNRVESPDASVITLAVMMSAEKLAVDVFHDLVEQGISQEQGLMPKTPIEMVQEAVDRFEKKLEISKGKGRGTRGRK